MKYNKQGRATKYSKSRKELDKKSSKELITKVGKKYTKWTRNCARKLLRN